MVLVLMAGEPAEACPNCREGLAAAGRATAYAFSAAFLLAMPFGLVVFWTRLILRCRGLRAASVAKEGTIAGPVSSDRPQR
jgi:hypothetical protein